MGRQLGVEVEGQVEGGFGSSGGGGLGGKRRWSGIGQTSCPGFY